MRQIEFRGLRTDGKGWIYGDLLHNHWTGGDTFTPCAIRYLIGDLYSYPIEVRPETVGQFTGLKGFEDDIAEVCIFLVSPENPDNDQHFRGFIGFENGAFTFTVTHYKTEKEWVKIQPRYWPFSDADISDDNTYTVPYFEFVAISGNLGEFNPDNVTIIGNIHESPELINK